MLALLRSLCSSAVSSQRACSLCAGNVCVCSVCVCLYSQLPVGVRTADLPPAPDVNIDGL